MITAKNLKKFVYIRNKATCHSNLQFVIDLNVCGINQDELIGAELYEEGCRWNFDCGTLYEYHDKTMKFEEKE